jgi:hypothetical protein
MSKLLFKLRNVPEDEAEDIRKLLAEHRIDCYETSGGRWGLGMPGIWLVDESRFQEARDLIDHYQEARRNRQNEIHTRLKEEGKNITFLEGIKNNPLRFILYIAIIAVVAYFSIKPFLDFGR